MRDGGSRRDRTYKKSFYKQGNSSDIRNTISSFNDEYNQILIFRTL